jgi:hypothetical protein
MGNVKLRGPHLAGTGGLLALPWCCLVPAALAFSGAGAGLLGVVRGPLGWSSLALSVALVGRANWLVWVRGQGAPAARRWTLLFSAAAAVLWAMRFAPYVHAWR